MLELRVHSPHPYPRTRLKLVIEVPDDAVASIGFDALPPGWDELPAGPASKRLGDEWVAGRSGLGLLVPSVVAVDERNLILNPDHPRFAEVRVVSTSRVKVDARLYSVPRKVRPKRK